MKIWVAENPYSDIFYVVQKTSFSRGGSEYEDLSKTKKKKPKKTKTINGISGTHSETSQNLICKMLLENSF